MEPLNLGSRGASLSAAASSEAEAGAGGSRGRPAARPRRRADEASALEDVGAVGQLQRLLDVLLDQQQREARRAQLGEDGEDLVDHDGARPSDGSSSISRRGSAIRARAPPASAARRRTACLRAGAAARRGGGTAPRRGQVLRDARAHPRAVGADLQVLPHRHLGKSCRPRAPAPRPARAARRRAGPACALAREPDRRRPAGRSSPATVLSSVVLPAPFEPITATSSPAATASDTSHSTCTSP